MANIDSFRAARWLRTLNLVSQAVLFLTFFLGLNYVARNHAQSWHADLTRHGRFSLSPETLSYIQRLNQPISVIVSVTEDSDFPDVRGFLKEYETATETRPPAGRITVRTLDPYQNRREAEQLGVEVAGAIVLRCGDRRRVVPIDELYVTKKRDREIVREAFIGEQVITSAMLEVSNPEPQHIYFLAGHLELRPDDVDRERGLSALRDQLRLRNFKVEALDLSVARKIPENASLLIAAAPQSRYSAAERELLRKYLHDAAGRVIFLLAPGVPVTSLGLDELLLDWGVLVDDDVIVDVGAQNMTEEGELIIGAFAPHPVTQTLIDNKYTLHLGWTRSVRPDPGRSLGAGLTTVTLAATSETAWGEISYSRQPWRYDPGIDLRPLPNADPRDRLGVAVASERVSVGANLSQSVRGGRLLVIGSGDLVSNARVANAGNHVLAFNAINWAVDRDYVLNVPVRPIERFQLSLSASELLKLRYALLFALPGAAAVLGLIVYWTRRS